MRAACDERDVPRVFLSDGRRTGMCDFSKRYCDSRRGFSTTHVVTLDDGFRARVIIQINRSW